MFIAAVFRIAKLWKQFRYSKADELIEKLWHIYTMEYYSAKKKNEILLFVCKWIELKNIMLCDVSQVQKVKDCIVALICGRES
jgi:hypothetical protein